MYESPIDAIYSDVVTKLEDGVLKAVQDVGITVDKEELIKALQYDRDQYRKGYEDAVLDKTHGKWVDKWHELWKEQLPVCSVCNNISIFKSNFCPNCGARMDEMMESEEEE